MSKISLTCSEFKSILFITHCYCSKKKCDLQRKYYKEAENWDVKSKFCFESDNNMILTSEVTHER